MNNTKTTITRTIEGIEITLEAGSRYVATRPLAQRGRKTYPVNIRVLAPNVFSGEVVHTIESLSYDQANKFLAAFNNEAISFDGRVW